jgi:hypothetical protein
MKLAAAGGVSRSSDEANTFTAACVDEQRVDEGWRKVWIGC